MHQCTERDTFPGYFCCRDETTAAESERNSHLVGFLLGSHMSLSLCRATRNARGYSPSVQQGRTNFMNDRRQSLMPMTRGQPAGDGRCTTLSRGARGGPHFGAHKRGFCHFRTRIPAPSQNFFSCLLPKAKRITCPQVQAEPCWRCLREAPHKACLQAPDFALWPETHREGCPGTRGQSYAEAANHAASHGSHGRLRAGRAGTLSEELAWQLT